MPEDVIADQQAQNRENGIFGPQPERLFGRVVGSALPFILV